MDAQGSLVATEDGGSTPFGIIGVQDRGLLFIPPKTEVASSADFIPLSTHTPTPHHTTPPTTNTDSMSSDFCT